MTTPSIDIDAALNLVNFIGYKQVAALCVAIFLATISFRDILFCLTGILAVVVLFILVQNDKIDTKNKKSRILIHFDEVKRDFNRQMERFDTIYAKERYFINNYSKGLYQHVAFDEQLDIIKWIESVEKKLQMESVKQFEDFEKSMSQMNELGVSKSLVFEDMAGDKVEFVEPGLTAEMSLRDTVKEFEMIDNIDIRQMDEKQIKKLFSDIKAVLNGFYKRNESTYKLWGELNNNAIDIFRKMFSNNSDVLPRQYKIFSLTIDGIFEHAPTLIEPDSPISMFLGGNKNATEGSKSLYLYDWDTLRTKITGENSQLVSRNSSEGKVYKCMTVGQQ